MKTRPMVALMLLLGLLFGLPACGTASCPKGQSWQIVAQYWAPAVYYPGHDVEEEISAKPLEFTEEWFPGYTIYGHFNYVYGCKVQ